MHESLLYLRYVHTDIFAVLEYVKGDCKNTSSPSSSIQGTRSTVKVVIERQLKLFFLFLSPTTTPIASPGNRTFHTAKIAYRYTLSFSMGRGIGKHEERQEGRKEGGYHCTVPDCTV